MDEDKAVWIIPQLGHNSDIISATIHAESNQLFSVDAGGGLCIWDIGAAIQVDYTNLRYIHRPTEVKTFDKKNRKKDQILLIEKLVNSGTPTEHISDTEWYKLSIKEDNLYVHGPSILHLYHIIEKGIQSTFLDPQVMGQGTLSEPGNLYVAPFKNLKLVFFRTQKNTLDVAREIEFETKSKEGFPLQIVGQSYNENKDRTVVIFDIVQDEKTNQWKQIAVDCTALIQERGKEEKMIPIPAGSCWCLGEKAESLVWLKDNTLSKHSLTEGTTIEISLETSGQTIALLFDADTGYCGVLTLLDGEENYVLEVYDFNKEEVRKPLFQKKFKEPQFPLVLSSKGRVGKSIVTTNGKKKLLLWDLETGILKREFGNTIPEVEKIELLDDDQVNIFYTNHQVNRLAINDQGVKLEYLFQLNPKGLSRSSRDGNYIAQTHYLGDVNATIIHLFSANKPAEILAKVQGRIKLLTYAPNSQFLATREDVDSKQMIRIYEVEKKRVIVQWEQTGVYDLAFRPEKNQIALLSYEKATRLSIVLWKANKVKKRRSLWLVEPTRRRKKISNVKLQFNHSGTLLVLSGPDRAEIIKLSPTGKMTPLTSKLRSVETGRVLEKGFLSKSFSTAYNSPMPYHCKGENYFLLRKKRTDKLEIWPETLLLKLLAKHKGNQGAYTREPYAVINAKKFPRDFILHMHTWPFILFANRKRGAIQIVSLDKWTSEYPRITLYPVDEDKYLLIMPKGYYLTNADGHGLVAFRFQEQVYPIEQFDLIFNRPDRVLEHLGKRLFQAFIEQLNKAYDKRLEKLLEQYPETKALLKKREDIDFSILNLPKTRILDKTDIPTILRKDDLFDEENWSYKEGLFSFRFNAKSQDGGIDNAQISRLYLYVNDVPYHGWGRLGISAFPDDEWEDSWDLTKRETIELSKGLNKIQVSALNALGGESLRDTIYIQYEGGRNKSSLYLIGIGVDKYKHSEQFDRDLNFAVKDTIAVNEKFEQKFGHAYEFVHQLLFTDLEVNKEILEEIKTFLGKTTVDDRVIIYFAGHGVRDENFDFFLATHDMDFGNPKEKGIPYEEFERVFDHIPARNKFILLDACFSGETDKRAAKERAKPIVKSRLVSRRQKIVSEADKTISNNKPSNRLISRRGKKSDEKGLENNKNTIGTNRLISRRTKPNENQPQKAQKQISRNGNALTIRKVDDSFRMMQELFVDLRRGGGATIITGSAGDQQAREGGMNAHGFFTQHLLDGLDEIAEKEETHISDIIEYLFKNMPKDSDQRPTLRRENISNNWRLK